MNYQLSITNELSTNYPILITTQYQIPTTKFSLWDYTQNSQFFLLSLHRNLNNAK